MKPLQWTFHDRARWGNGPWDTEPDKMQWTDEATGLPCLAHRSFMGNWCGYVGVSPGHPFYERDFDEAGRDLSVHGGLTYAQHCAPDHDPVSGNGICHLPEPGEPDDVFWLGFDCAHAFDYVPGTATIMSEMRERRETPGEEVALDVLTAYEHLIRHDTYRDLEYVRRECASLASQIAQVKA